MMADFEVDLAAAIGDVLLLDAHAVPLPDANITTPPLDFRLPLLGEQVFIVLADRCAAILGFGLSDSVPEWLLVTRPYMQTRTVLVTTDPQLRSLAEVPYDRPIGARGMSVADNRLINFLQARPEDQRWKRFPFFSNQVVMDMLRDGTIGVGLIWEPALYFATGGDPESQGFHVLQEMPFDAPAVELGIATRSDERYLNEQLSGAIEALQADGTIDRLLREHNLSAAGGAGGG
jgi:polar amino acid transport system substrate-binding protein